MTCALEFLCLTGVKCELPLDRASRHMTGHQCLSCVTMVLAVSTFVEAQLVSHCWTRGPAPACLPCIRTLQGFGRCSVGHDDPIFASAKGCVHKYCAFACLVGCPLPLARLVQRCSRCMPPPELGTLLLCEFLVPVGVPYGVLGSVRTSRHACLKQGPAGRLPPCGWRGALGLDHWVSKC